MLMIHISVEIRKETVQWGMMVFFVFHKNRNLNLSHPSTIQHCATYLQPEEKKGHAHFHSYPWCVLKKKHCQLTSGVKIDIFSYFWSVFSYSWSIVQQIRKL